MDQCLTFDISGDFGFFKKFYTTSSPLTYEIPPKTALTGILGAILGLSYKQRYKLFECKFGIRILNPIRKIYLGINWLNTKVRNSKNFLNSSKEFLECLQLPTNPSIATFLGMGWTGQSPHTQAKLELLKEPKYRIYYPNTNIFFDDLIEQIKAHKSFFTPFLGVSEFICDFKFHELYSLTKIENNISEIEISTIIPTNLLNLDISNPINFKHSNLYKINTPYLMEYPRIIKNYQDIFYNPLGKSIKVVVIEYYELRAKNNKNIENVVFF